MLKEIFLTVTLVFLVSSCGTTASNELTGRGFGGVVYKHSTGGPEKSSDAVDPGTNRSKRLGFGGFYYSIPTDELKP